MLNKKEKMFSKNKSKSKSRGEAITAYLMLLPDILGLGIFVFIPMLYAIYVSFHQWNGLTDMQFTGLDNYKRLLADKDFFNSLKTTLTYAIIYIPSVYCISLGLAMITVNLKGKLEVFARMAYFIPYSISTVVAALVWTFMYDPKRGYFNKILGMLGFENQNFLADRDQALFAVIAVGVWLIVGYNMVIFISALKDVPKMYYEAAEMDGANALQKFFNVTMPQIKNTTVFILVVTTIGSFQVFDQIKIMTNGGPAKATEVTVFRIYDQAFTMYDFGYSSTMAVALFFLIMGLSYFQFKSMGEDKGASK
ncbi:multiple sugar transport system permease protein [Enterococcus sp. PF1-24]|uniref:carbohydrate ABC transporter permease n=1 Tax=unclassified Enterococcus TaxID=2608891 RepID=UPI0024730A05|nr:MULTISPECIES: sugar ABC transporter permease [unclassified Enterococcus]MDH6363859.1 multiple sugar transport system permease protein [Enterococcus sp. PFB1-1]MDH6400955.1 multiple sugar transport system permease protein [Enterococcus sp. PF1-24]